MIDSTKRIAQLSHLSKAQNAALGAVMNALKSLSPDDAQQVLDHAIANLAGGDLPTMLARGICVMDDFGYPVLVEEWGYAWF